MSSLSSLSWFESNRRLTEILKGASQSGPWQPVAAVGSSSKTKKLNEQGARQTCLGRHLRHERGGKIET